MNKLKKYKKLLLLLLPLIMTSCATTPEKKIDSVYVMVYDCENSPLMDANIFVDNAFIGSTDIYGRLMFASRKNKKQKNETISENIHEVRLEKTDYETVKTQSKLQPGELLYFRTGNSTYYAEKAEEALDNNEIQDALIFINKALEIKDRKDFRYLKNIIEGRNVEWKLQF